MIGRRRLLAGGAALAGGLRPVRADSLLYLLAGAPAGSAPDVQACSFAPFLERHLPGTQVGVRDVVGEAGLAACRALAAAPPDGTTLGWVATPQLPARLVDHTAGPLPDGLILLGAVQQEPLVLVTPAGAAGSLGDLIALLAGDGDAPPLGTPPAGSPGHLAAIGLQAALRQRSDQPAIGAAGALNLIAFPSEAAARQAVLDGNVAAALLPLGSVLAALRDGRLAGAASTAGAGTGATANAVLPDLASFRDSGIDFSSEIRRGLAAPAGLAADISRRLSDALQAVVADAEFQDQGRAAGFTAAWLDGADWTAQLQQQRTALAALWQAEPWTGPGSP